MKKRPVLLMVLAACMAVASALYAAHANGAPPGVTMLDALVDEYEAVRFDHAAHTLMAEGCGTCHHQHGDESGTCKGCHLLGQEDFRQSVTSGFLSCGACHGTYDPASPNVPGLKAAYHRQCFECHRSMEGIGLDPRNCAGKCHARRVDR